jgi:hypothetical protein
MEKTSADAFRDVVSIVGNVHLGYGPASYWAVQPISGSMIQFFTVALRPAAQLVCWLE